MLASRRVAMKLNALKWPGRAIEVLPAPPPCRWPDLTEMRGVTRTRRSNVGRQIKLAWGLLLTAPYRASFNRVLEAHRHWHPLFTDQARSFEPLVQTFMDRRFTTAQRFAHLQQDLTSATRLFGSATGARLAQGERITLWHLEGIGPVCLSANQVCKREGSWSLGLWTDDGVRLCQISFSFLCRERLMIRSVQGASCEDECAMRGIRGATRAAEGLRPPHLLVEVLRVLCRRGQQTLAAVDPEHHVKKRWHQRLLRVSFDHRGFWTELGGQRQDNGIWALPTQRVTRDLADVPPKRRAMYKRRAGLLDDLSCQVQQLTPGEHRS